jgi:predicted O-methyltransferase YrrM
MNRRLLLEKLLTACHYIDYLIKSKHRKGRGIHSPFVFELVSKVLFDRHDYPEYQYLDQIRNELKNSKEEVEIYDIGSRSKIFQTNKRSVSQMVSHLSISPKYGKLLFRLVRYYKPQQIIELGTSIGISAFYMAKGSPESKIVTLEGNPSLVAFAGDLFKRNGIDNIEIKEGLFDELLPPMKQNYQAPGLVFIDGNHTCDATLRYFLFFSNCMDEGFIIIDDIHWSRDMHKAWKQITLNPRAKVSINLFRLGIIILNDNITPGYLQVRH